MRNASPQIDRIGRAFTNWRVGRYGNVNLGAAFRAGAEWARAVTGGFAAGGIINGRDAMSVQGDLKDVRFKPGVPTPANNNEPLFSAVRHLVRDVLHRPFDRPWSIQGFGMLRTYFGADKQWRLNIWDRRFMVRTVSVVHDHPWHFRSYVLAGRFTNVRYFMHAYQTRYEVPYGPYTVSAALPNFHCQTIKTGEGGGPVGEVENVFLIAQQPEIYGPGDTYKQAANEIHASYYEDGTVTLNDRTRLADGEHARVFWPLGTSWVDAEPRNATEEEIWASTRRALSWFERDARQERFAAANPRAALD